MAKLLVEVEVAPGVELRAIPCRHAGVRQAAARLAASVSEPARKFSREIDTLQKAHGAGWTVSEVDVTFGLAVEPSGNILVARGTLGANISARIAWRQER